MSHDYGAGGYSLLLFLFAVLLFASPFAAWWASQSPPWYTPYLIWVVLIGATALAAHRSRRHDV
ncbi:MAG: hypothetical protein PVF40_03170 [Ectothiorhodospiraceae bacterium]|jgi:hypothetical protein